MTPAVSTFEDEAEAFAQDLAEVLHNTVADDAPGQSLVAGDRVSVAPLDERRDQVGIPLTIDGDPCLELGFSMECTLDSSGRYLAVDRSSVSLRAAMWRREAIVRFEFDSRRSWADAHINVHGENGALAYVLAVAARKRGHPPHHPKLQVLHLVVGGKRFRPCLEDVIEMTVGDFEIDTKNGWREHLEAGRRRWHRKQLFAAMRDMVREDPVNAPVELRRRIDSMVDDVAGVPGVSAHSRSATRQRRPGT